MTNSALKYTASKKSEHADVPRPHPRRRSDTSAPDVEQKQKYSQQTSTVQKVLCLFRKCIITVRFIWYRQKSLRQNTSQNPVVPSSKVFHFSVPIVGVAVLLGEVFLDHPPTEVARIAAKQSNRDIPKYCWAFRAVALLPNLLAMHTILKYFKQIR